MKKTLNEIGKAALAAATEVAPAPDTVQHIAFRAMRALYPQESGWLLGIVLSFPAPNLAEGMSALFQGVGIFGDVEVDHVIGTLVASQYGERAL